MGSHSFDDVTLFCAQQLISFSQVSTVRGGGSSSSNRAAAAAAWTLLVVSCFFFLFTPVQGLQLAREAEVRGFEWFDTLITRHR